MKPAAATSSPTGLTPAQVRTAYNLPSIGGSGTIAVVVAYDNPSVQANLDTFSCLFGLPLTSTGYFTKFKMSSTLATDASWSLESALDTQWAHAIAPNAKILLVKGVSPTTTNLLAAVNYAKSVANVVAVSMSWGAAEFSTELS
jgi:subtilase family serine protease